MAVRSAGEEPLHAATGTELSELDYPIARTVFLSEILVDIAEVCNVYVLCDRQECRYLRRDEPCHCKRTAAWSDAPHRQRHERTLPDALSCCWLRTSPCFAGAPGGQGSWIAHAQSWSTVRNGLSDRTARTNGT